MTADFFRKQKTQMYFAELRVVREVAGSYYMLGLDFLRKLQLFRRKKKSEKNSVRQQMWAEQTWFKKKLCFTDSWI